SVTFFPLRSINEKSGTVRRGAAPSIDIETCAKGGGSFAKPPLGIAATETAKRKLSMNFISVFLVRVGFWL
ncbi:MAG TPA: hypothetical protein VLH17_03095, partial [Candidatus Binatia bacterium]|nr:hypothetical protein [Candidatus Binatia bacterium]